MISKTALLALGMFASAHYEEEMIYPDAAWSGSLLYQDQDADLGRAEDSTSINQPFSHIVPHSIRKCVCDITG